MDYTRLGRTNLEVSRSCFGTWQFGGEWGAVERERSTSRSSGRPPDHIEGSAPAAEIELSDADLGEIEEIMGRMAPVGGPTPEAA